MDPDIIAWIIEFLIRKRVPALFLNAILTDPRFSVREINNPRCKKTICLRTIQDEISDGAVSSELILDLLEIIEELDRKEGNLITDSMKLAYRAAAVECTVKYLRSPREKNEGLFFEAVKRIWRERIQKLELLKKSELVTDELRVLKEDIEAALWDPKASGRLLAKVGQTNAVRLVRDYVNEALVIMGPSFIELASRAETELKMKKKNGYRVKMKEASERNASPEVVVLDGAATPDLKRKRKNGDEIELEEGSKSNAGPELVGLDGPAMRDADKVETEEGSKADAGPELVVLDGQPASPEIGDIQRNGVLQSCSPETACDTMDSQRVDTSIRSTNFYLIPTPKVMKVREALKRSFMELKALVNDPLPEALRVSDAIRDEIREKSLNEGTSVENQNGNDMDPPSPINAEASRVTRDILYPPNAAEVSRATAEILNPPVDAEVSRAATEILQVNQNMKTNAEISNHNHQIVASHRSLMERNSTACTFEWNDSIDGTSEEVANSNKDKLPAESSRRKLVSCKINNVVRRRPSKRWSLEEEDALRKGVKKFGAGNWKLILHSNRDLFVDRKAVDLKDKWRNMTKYSEWQGT